MKKIKFSTDSLALGYYQNNFVDVCKYFRKDEEENINELFGLFTAQIDEVKVIPLPAHIENYIAYRNILNQVLDQVNNHKGIDNFIHYSLYKE